MNILRFFSALLFAAVLLVSCTTKSSVRFEKLVNATLRNEFLPAIEQIKMKPSMYGKASELLYNMDIGTLYHYAEKYDSSNRYLLRAADIYEELFTRSVTNEAAAILVNDNVRPYRSKPYELVMLHQLIALNYCAQNNIEDALVETRRTQLLFNEWERKTRDDEKYTNDPMFHYVSSILYDSRGETSDAMISLFKSVDAFNKGPVTLPVQINDYAWRMFTLNNRESDNTLLKLKPAVLKELSGAAANEQSEIIVIGFAGRSPALEENVWWGTYVKDGLLVVYHRDADGRENAMTLPAPMLPESELQKAENNGKTKSGTTFHIKFAMPEIKKVASQTESFSVNCTGMSNPVQTVVINDLEKQLEKYLDDTRAKTIARTVIRVILRTITAEKTKDKLQTGNALANLLLNVGTDIIADQMEKADTRSCFLLPKTVQIARIPVIPGKLYDVDIEALSRSGGSIGSKKISGITVARNEKRFIFYASFK